MVVGIVSLCHLDRHVCLCAFVLLELDEVEVWGRDLVEPLIRHLWSCFLLWGRGSLCSVGICSKVPWPFLHHVTFSTIVSVTWWTTIRVSQFLTIMILVRRASYSISSMVTRNERTIAHLNFQPSRDTRVQAALATPLVDEPFVISVYMFKSLSIN